MPRKRNLDAAAVALMISLCAIWGFQQVAIKFAIDEVPPIWQAALRSLLAAAVLAGWIRLAGYRWTRGLTSVGLLAGGLFSLEFGLLYFSLLHTDAARASLLLYTSPFVVAVGAHFVVADERLSPWGWLGVLLAFIGTAVIMQTSMTLNRQQLLGDLCALGGGIAWGMTSLVIRTTALSRAEPAQTLFYQLLVSAVVLGIAAWAMEGSVQLPQTLPAWSSMFFQVMVVATCSYLTWFMLMLRYSVTTLSVFGFLTPLFGSAYAVIFLDEAIGKHHLIALLLIVCGIVIVNRYGLSGRQNS